LGRQAQIPRHFVPRNDNLFRMTAYKEGITVFMQPSKTLPDDYKATATLDLSENRKLAVGLNVLGLIFFFLFALLFTIFAAVLRYNSEGGELSFSISRENWGSTLGWVILIVVLVVVIHELIHALFFRLFTGEWATFGFKGIYAYAAAPQWLVLSLLGVVLILWIDYALLPALLLFLIINAAGAVGDLVTVGWMLRQPRDAYVNDYGDGFTVYTTQ
jgi:Putative zincin peptidase